jgi:aminoglycoside 2'-N-acetyltransferase I
MDLLSFPKAAVPRDIAIQIRSYTRIQWPHVEQRIGTKLWDVPADFPARSFVLLDGEKLISHAEANFRPVQHAGDTFNVGGLSAVFTFPGYRGKGHAAHVVRAATEHLDLNGADLSMLFCGEPLRRFYAACGWEAVAGAQVLCGVATSPTPYENGLVVVRFTSERGRAARERFTAQPVYVGERTW